MKFAYLCRNYRNFAGSITNYDNGRRSYANVSQENASGFNDDDFSISLTDTTKHTKTSIKRHKRQQGIIGLIRQNPVITIEEMAERLDANERTIKRDIEELKAVIEHVGPTKGGTWRIIKK